MAASISSKHALGYRHLAEPITTVITGALPRVTEQMHHGSAVVSRRLSLTFSTPELLVLVLAGWISLAARSSRSLGTRSRDRQTTTIINRREGLNGRDALREENPIVT